MSVMSCIHFTTIRISVLFCKIAQVYNLSVVLQDRINSVPSMLKFKKRDPCDMSPSFVLCSILLQSRPETVIRLPYFTSAVTLKNITLLQVQELLC